MKRTRLRKSKERSTTWWRNKCVVIAKLLARARDNDTCQFCGKSKGQGYVIHGSHVLPEGTYKSMSADVDNIIALCAVHHLSGANPRMGSKEPSWHGDPLYFAEWFNKKYPGRHQELRIRAQVMKIVNWEQKYKELYALFKEIN